MARCRSRRARTSSRALGLSRALTPWRNWRAAPTTAATPSRTTTRSSLLDVTLTRAVPLSPDHLHGRDDLVDLPFVVDDVDLAVGVHAEGADQADAATEGGSHVAPV